LLRGSSKDLLSSRKSGTFSYVQDFLDEFNCNKVKYELPVPAARKIEQQISPKIW
jgi:hypothetical protein